MALSIHRIRIGLLRLHKGSEAVAPLVETFRLQVHPRACGHQRAMGQGPQASDGIDEGTAKKGR